MRGRGVVSLIVLALVWLALDDITTDNADRFPLEYGILLLAGLWFLGLGGWLIARRRVAAGLVSLGAVALGLLAFWSLPHHDQPPAAVNDLGYVPLAWFAGTAVWLLAARLPRGRDGRL